MSLHLKLLDIDHPLTFEESKLRQIEAHALIYLRNKELKEQRRRRLRKRHLKREVALLQPLQRVFHLVQFVICWQLFLELNSKKLYRSSRKKGSRCLVFTSSTKHEVKLSRALTGKICTKKSDARCCFANLNLILFFYLVNCNLPSHCYSPPSSFYLRISFLLLPYLIYFITKYQQKELKC